MKDVDRDVMGVWGGEWEKLMRSPVSTSVVIVAVSSASVLECRASLLMLCMAGIDRVYHSYPSVWMKVRGCGREVK